MSKMSWFSLESIKNWGAPVEVDGCKLKLHQAKVLVGLVEDLMDDAGFEKRDAVEHALAAFKLMYERAGSEWIAKKNIHLKDHGVSVRSKFYKKDHKERVMARVRAEFAEKRNRDRIVRQIIEAGRRNSGKDKKAIDAALGGLFDVLNKTDQKAVLKALGQKLGKNIRFKREET